MARCAATPLPHLMSDATCTFTILSGSATGSPRLILSTTSMPDTTSPITVYFPFSEAPSANMMKNCELAESLLAALGMLGREIGSQLDDDAALGGVDHDRIRLVEIGGQRLGDRGGHKEQRGENGENADHESSGHVKTEKRGVAYQRLSLRTWSSGWLRPMAARRPKRRHPSPRFGAPVWR